MDSKMIETPSQADIARMIDAAFPNRTWQDYGAEQLKGGLFNTTYLISPNPLNGARYVLRCGPVRRDMLYPYEAHLMDAECWAYEKMAEHGIPTSTVVYKDTSKTLVNRDFMVVEYIESIQLSSAELNDADKYKVYRDTGRYCRMMTEITGEKFGRVSYILHGGGYDTWSAYIKSEISEWAEKVREKTPDYFTPEELDLILSVADRHRAVLDEITVPRFNHCDIWRMNILIEKTGKPEIVAIIDPDRATMGDPDFELSSGWMMNDAFYDGYGRRMAEDDATRIRTDIYKMIFLLLDGYFVRTQYDDPEPSVKDKERAMEYLARLA